MVASRVARILAPNPSPMTLEGSNTYLIDAGDFAVVIDPGPPIDRHVDAIVEAARDRGLAIGAILVTHGHPDHAPAAAPLAARTGAPVYAHARASFPHDRTWADGRRLRFGELELIALDTPGHAVDHLAFGMEEEGALFAGDVIVGRGTVVVAPPFGDMRAYQATLGRLQDNYASARTIYGGHGEAVDDPRAKIAEYIAHRAAREGQVLSALAERPSTVPDLVERIYRDTPAVLWPAAARQVLAHLIALESEGRVVTRTLAREPDAREAAILNPDLSRLADPSLASVAAAELGFDRAVERIVVYEPAP